MVFVTYLPSLMRYFAVTPDAHVKKIGHREVIAFIMRSLPMLFILIPNIAYLIVKFDPKNIFELTDLLYTIVLLVCNWDGYLILTMYQTHFRDLWAELKLFIETRELTESKDIYVKAAILMDKICRLYITVCVTGSLEAFVMPYVKPFYHHLKGKYSFASWYTPYKTLMPYDIDQTSLGFAIVLFGQQVGLLTTCFCSALTLNTHASLNYYVVTVLTDICATIKRLNRFLANQTSSGANETIIRNNLIEILKFHYWIIQLRDRIGDLLNMLIFNYMVAAIGCMCTLMFQLHVTAENTSSQLYQSAGQLATVLLFVLIFCFFGHLVTEKSFTVAHAAYATKWYNLPLKYRLVIKMIIQYSHQPYNLSAWGLIDCNLEKFAGLIRTSMSFYMLFRNFA